MEAVDLYCERIEPGLWAEPLNAATNAAFFVAVWFAWRLGLKQRKMTLGVWLLIGLVVAFGLGSMLFHSFANTLTQALDALPIAFFVVVYLWLYANQVLHFGWIGATALSTAFVVAAVLARHFPWFLNGSLIYAPALLFILALGLNHYLQARQMKYDLLAAAGVFAAAIFCRTIDNWICSSFPVGTHFLWHLLTATALFLVARALISNLHANDAEKRP